MYLPRHFQIQDRDDIEALVRSVGAADLVTIGPDGIPEATRVPILWDGRTGTVFAHLARANPQWRNVSETSPALLIVTAQEAYVSPNWYPSKAVDGRVVPTWNYSAVHLTGTITVHDDVEFVRDVVTRLTDAHESGRAAPWAVTDAPDPYIERQLRAIVGITVHVSRIEAKAKLSQNRSAADQAGVLAGLLAESGPLAASVAAAMSPPHPA
jgi:transcriptional regulator